MKNFQIMQCLQPLDDLYKDRPNVGLWEQLVLALLLNDPLVQVSVVGKLHHDAE